MISTRRSTQAGLCRHHGHNLEDGRDVKEGAGTAARMWRRASLQDTVDASADREVSFPPNYAPAFRQRRRHRQESRAYHRLPLQRSLSPNTPEM